MAKYVYIRYDEAKELLQEGDIALFRTRGFISALIKMAGEGLYSHVAIASKHEDEFEIVEYREWFNGRTINLENYVRESKKSKTEIDIYRPIKIFSSIRFDSKTREFIEENKVFNAKQVTKCMRKLTGLPYSYRRIWLMLKIKLFRWHILWNIEKITNEIPTKEVIMPVCSTVLSHCFSINGFPILRTKSDEYTEPSDFSLSPRLNYLFTLNI